MTDPINNIILKSFEFHGAELEVFDLEGQAYVNIDDIAHKIGKDQWGQRLKLRKQPFYFDATIVVSHPKNKRGRKESYCLKAEWVSPFLSTFQMKRVDVQHHGWLYTAMIGLSNAVVEFLYPPLPPEVIAARAILNTATSQAQGVETVPLKELRERTERLEQEAREAREKVDSVADTVATYVGTAEELNEFKPTEPKVGTFAEVAHSFGLYGPDKKPLSLYIKTLCAHAGMMKKSAFFRKGPNGTIDVKVDAVRKGLMEHYGTNPAGWPTYGFSDPNLVFYVVPSAPYQPDKTVKPFYYSIDEQRWWLYTDREMIASVRKPFRRDLSGKKILPNPLAIQVEANVYLAWATSPITAWHLVDQALARDTGTVINDEQLRFRDVYEYDEKMKRPPSYVFDKSRADNYSSLLREYVGRIDDKETLEQDKKLDV